MSSHGLPRERCILASGHDFTVVAYDTEREERTNSNGVKIVEHIPKKAHDFAVSRNVLERVPYFRAILATRGLRDTSKDFHELHEDDPAAWKIWMQILHDTVDTDSYEFGIATVWNVLVIADKYELSPKSEAAKRWCASWYKRWGDPETLDDCSEALYSCHTFDHPRGFVRATKLLAYENEGHIGEQMLLGGQVYHLRLDNRITQLLNAARGRLRTIISRELYAPARKMLAAGDASQCQYKEKVLWAYLKDLEETSVWPSESMAHNDSIDSILSRLQRFEWSDPHPYGAKFTTCVPLGGVERAVKAAIERTQTYFDGLCLDCMNSAKTGDEDRDYWKDLSSNMKKKFTRGYSGRWDQGCRVRHEEPSWYFSFVGSWKVFDEWKFARDEQTD